MPSVLERRVHSEMGRMDVQSSRPLFLCGYLGSADEGLPFLSWIQSTSITPKLGNLSSYLAAVASLRASDTFKIELDVGQ